MQRSWATGRWTPRLRAGRAGGVSVTVGGLRQARHATWIAVSASCRRVNHARSNLIKSNTSLPGRDHSHSTTAQPCPCICQPRCRAVQRKADRVGPWSRLRSLKGASPPLCGSTCFQKPILNFGPNFGQLHPRATAQPVGHPLNGPTGSPQSIQSQPTPALGQPLGWGHANQGCLANEQGVPDRKPDMSGRSYRGRRVGTP